MKNIPALHDERKKQRGVWLTDTAWQSVQELAVREGVSASEYLEVMIKKNCVTKA